MKDEKINQDLINARQIKKDGELFRYIGKNNKMINVNILDESCKGKKVSDYLNELKEANSLIKASQSLLAEILVINGYEIKEEDLKSLLEQISKIQIVHPGKKYVDIDVDFDGYINRSKEIIGLIVEANDTMINIENGCYYIEKNKLVLDEEKMKLKILLEED